MNDLYQILDMLRGVQNRLTAAVSNPVRPWKGFAGNNGESNQRGILLYGPRGTGKTTYLLRMAQMVSGVYLEMASSFDPYSAINFDPGGKKLFLLPLLDSVRLSSQRERVCLMQ